MYTWLAIYTVRYIKIGACLCERACVRVFLCVCVYVCVFWILSPLRNWLPWHLCRLEQTRAKNMARSTKPLERSRIRTLIACKLDLSLYSLLFFHHCLSASHNSVYVSSNRFPRSGSVRKPHESSESIRARSYLRICSWDVDTRSLALDKALQRANETGRGSPATAGSSKTSERRGKPLGRTMLTCRFDCHEPHVWSISSRFSAQKYSVGWKWSVEVSLREKIARIEGRCTCLSFLLRRLSSGRSESVKLEGAPKWSSRTDLGRLDEAASSCHPSSSRSRKSENFNRRLTDALDDVTILDVHVGELGDAHDDSDAHPPACIQEPRVTWSLCRASSVHCHHQHLNEAERPLLLEKHTFCHFRPSRNVPD